MVRVEPGAEGGVPARVGGTNASCAPVAERVLGASDDELLPVAKLRDVEAAPSR